MRRVAAMIAAACAACFMAATAMAGPLQDLIDAAADGATVKPPAGIYAEHITITKPVDLDGSSGVVIDGGGEGTVVRLLTDKATLKNLTIRNSGRLHNAIDAGLRVEGNNNLIKDNTIQNTLFGIDVHEGDSNILRRNDISSKDMPLELKGDSIRLWYSHFNRVEDNFIHGTRDFAVWYSHDNTISGNRIHGTRYGVHFMYAHHNNVEKNDIADCVVGLFLMYSNDLTITGNKLLRSWGASGMGIGMKESSGVVAANNEIMGNAVGIFLDLSPYDPDATNQFERNQVAYNGTGVEFSADWESNVFRNNSFNTNFTQIAVALVIAGLLAATGVLGWMVFQQRQLNEVRDEAQRAAVSYAQVLTSIDSAKVDDNFKQVLDGATGEFKDMYSQSSVELRQLLVENKATAHGVVIESAVQSASKDKAVVLLFVDQSVSNTKLPDPRIDRSRMKMTMEKVDGAWRASKVELP